MKKQVISFFVIISLLLYGTVTANAADLLRINQTALTLAISETYTLKISGTNSKIKWSTSDEKIATVSESGRIKALSYGEAVISAKVDGKTLSCKLNVKSYIIKIHLHQ